MNLLTETLLEFHYHRALLALFEEVFGKKWLRLLKPSPNEEAFLGFDQGWVRVNVKRGDFLEGLKPSASKPEVDKTLKQAAGDLKAGIAAGSKRVDTLFLGYFLQFKPVGEMRKRTGDAKKIAGLPVPYFRAELSLKPNKKTKLSQHETLLRLNKIQGADVYYACPMIFDHDDIYEEPDLDKLRLVALTGAPGGYATNEKHYIVFKAVDDDLPNWISEPVQGNASGARAWATTIAEKHPLMTLPEFRKWLMGVEEEWRAVSTEEHAGGLPPVLTIVEFSREAAE